MSDYQLWVEVVGQAVEGAGVLVIVLGALVATARAVWPRAGGERFSYRAYRQNLGRAILLGLEFLVAGDIISTVGVDPKNLRNVATLGLIVLIRTFLSMALEVELEGRWPWERYRSEARPPNNSAR